MSVYRRMIGRELPCGVLGLLEISVSALSLEKHEELADLARLGLANAESLHRLAQSHLARLEYGLARKRLLDAMLGRPDFVAARLLLAGVCDVLGQHEEAAAHLDTVLAHLIEEEAPAADGRSRYSLLCAAGLCLERQGAWQEAASRYQLALTFHPTDSFALHRLTAIHLAHGEQARAIDCLREFLAAQPQDQAARICLGHLLQLAGKRGSAIWEYEQALCLQPESWELPLEAANELHAMDNSDAAIGVLEKLIGAQPHFPDLRMRLANLYSQRGEDDLARSEYEKALALHPEYLDCHIALARHELRGGRIEEAAEHFRRAIAINEQNVEACAALAAALHRSGRRKRGVEMLNSAARISSNSAILMAQLAALEAEDAWAESALAAGLELHADLIRQQVARDAALLEAHRSWGELRLRQAMLLRLLGHADQAVALLREALAGEPRDGEAQLHLAMALAEQGQAKEAFQAIAQSLAGDGYRSKLEYQLALICCGDLAFDLAMESVEQAQPVPEDVQRCIWSIAERMHLTGLRRAADESRRNGVGVREK